MRTTLVLDDAVMKEAKQRAAADGQTLTRVVETALRQYLRERKKPPARFKLELISKKGRTLPGVNLDDRDALYDRMENR